MKTTRSSNEPKETREMKRKRVENSEKARETAKKIVYPVIGAVMLALVAFFFYKYGLGYSPSKAAL